MASNAIQFEGVTAVADRQVICLFPGLKPVAASILPNPAKYFT